MGLSTKRSEDGKELTIAIDGRFDFNLHSDFRNAYRDMPANARFVIDLRDTTFMDSSAMGMLLLLREHAGEKDADIHVLNCSPDVRKVLKISNLDRIFTMD